MHQDTANKYHFVKVLDSLCCMIDPACIAVEYYKAKGADKVEITYLNDQREETRLVLDISGLSLGQIAQTVIGNL